MDKVLENSQTVSSHKVCSMANICCLLTVVDDNDHSCRLFDCLSEFCVFLCMCAYVCGFCRSLGLFVGSDALISDTVLMKYIQWSVFMYAYLGPILAASVNICLELL